MPAIAGAGRDQQPADGRDVRRSSATRRAKGTIALSGRMTRSSTSVDLPDAGRPAIRLRRRRGPLWRGCVGAVRSHQLRAAHHEARAEDRGSSVRPAKSCVLGRERAAMRLDDLPGDRQAEAGILAEPCSGPVGIEALEDPIDRSGRMPGPLSSTMIRCRLFSRRQVMRTLPLGEKERAFSIRLVMTWPSRKSWPGD